MPVAVNTRQRQGLDGERQSALRRQRQGLGEGCANRSRVRNRNDGDRLLSAFAYATMRVFDTLDGARDAASEVGKTLAVRRTMGCRRLPQRAMPSFVVTLAFPIAEVLFGEVVFVQVLRVNPLLARPALRLTRRAQCLRCLFCAFQCAANPKIGTLRQSRRKVFYLCSYGIEVGRHIAAARKSILPCRDGSVANPKPFYACVFLVVFFRHARGRVFGFKIVASSLAREAIMDFLMPAPSLSHVLSRVRPSATIAASTRAGELRREGHDIVSLSAGEPDFDTPDFIVAAATKALSEGKTRYAPAGGIPELREAIARKLKRENATDLPPRCIAVTCGAKQAIYNALVASLNPGDEVIVPAPYWVSYPDMVTLAGGSPVIVETKEEEGFLLTPESLQNALSENTRWLILNSPSNPTGAVYSRRALQDLGEVIVRHRRVGVVSDEIYEHLVYGGVPFVSFAEACPYLLERTLLVNGVSKAFAMTGWRIGYAAGAENLIKGMNVIQSQSASSATTFCQWAATAALDSDMAFFAPMLQAFRERRDFVVQALNAVPGLSCAVPQGAFYVFPSCADLIGRKTEQGKRIEDDQALCLYALEQAGVAMVHGAAFGASPYLRCSYACSMEQLEEATVRLTKAFAALS